jgi:hypothetical protein
MRQTSPSPTDQELLPMKRRRDPSAGSDVRFFDWHTLSPSSNSIMSDHPSTFTPSSLIAGCNPGVPQPRPPTCPFNPPLSRPPVPVNVHTPATTRPLNLLKILNVISNVPSTSEFLQPPVLPAVTHSAMALRQSRLRTNRSFPGSVNERMNYAPS